MDRGTFVGHTYGTLEVCNSLLLLSILSQTNYNRIHIYNIYWHGTHDDVIITVTIVWSLGKVRLGYTGLIPGVCTPHSIRCWMVGVTSRSM